MFYINNVDWNTGVKDLAFITNLVTQVHLERHLIQTEESPVTTNNTNGTYTTTDDLGIEIEFDRFEV